MSRAAPAKSVTAAVKRDPRMGSGSPQDEVCPVCKSSRYLNSSLRFLVNPECYHKMCESCVDRIFSHGPAPCPIAGCQRTLRKHRFREQTFEDIQVEREVDIRKRVAAVFNRREDEFETLRDYNDYLNDVEDITFNLINLIDVEETNRRFDAYQKAHEREIAENAQLAQEETQSFAARQKLERQNAKLRREAARREEEQERREQDAVRKDMLDRLAAGQDPDQVAAQGQQVQLKKRMDRQAAAERQRQLQDSSLVAADSRNGSGDLVIKGLRARARAEPEKAVDPFDGLDMSKTKYYILQDDYSWEGYQDAKKESKVMAGGYDIQTFSARALREAFAGLGICIADEMTERDRAKQDGRVVATLEAEMSARDAKMTDVF